MYYLSSFGTLEVEIQAQFEIYDQFMPQKNPEFAKNKIF
jgi:hypothetical protein